MTAVIYRIENLRRRREMLDADEKQRREKAQSRPTLRQILGCDEPPPGGHAA